MGELSPELLEKFLEVTKSIEDKLKRTNNENYAGLSSVNGKILKKEITTNFTQTPIQSNKV